MELPHCRRLGLAAWALLALLPGAGLAQNPAEIASRDEPSVFKARVNLVLVPVVVRDRQGRAVGNLRKEDFQLFDRGRQQEITRFSVERPGSRGTAENAAAPGAPLVAPPIIPERFVAYLFDDIHLAFADLARVREAARRQMGSLRATDRAAIYSTSGQTTLEFTGDRDQLHETLNRLQPRPMAGGFTGMGCPDIGFYMADLIENHHDTQALSAAVAEVMACQQQNDTMRELALKSAEDQVRAEAKRVLREGEHETRVSLAVLGDVVKRLSTMPGGRTLVLISPGFFTPEQQMEKNELLDRAVRANVVINSLDARGLYTDPALDSRRRTIDIHADFVKSRYYRAEALAQADVLAELAAGTGGTLFENSNDLDAGFERLAGAPESYYVLGFSPQNLKLDGRFHNLKVTIKSLRGTAVAARRGYYAPTRLADAAENARREISEALFSREEMHDLPAAMHTQFFKPGGEASVLAVTTRLDPKHIPFRKEEDRNRNTLTIVNGLFDRNGNFIMSITKTIELRLRDESLARLSVSGMTVRANFEVKPGSYVIRLVVRDAEGQLMSAENGSIEIP